MASSLASPIAHAALLALAALCVSCHQEVRRAPIGPFATSRPPGFGRLPACGAAFLDEADTPAGERRAALTRFPDRDEPEPLAAPSGLPTLHTHCYARLPGDRASCLPLDDCLLLIALAVDGPAPLCGVGPFLREERHPVTDRECCYRLGSLVD